MAEVQESGPLLGEPFTDDQWETIFAGMTGIISDTDGSAFDLTLPAGSDVAEVGSATLDSNAVVHGRGLRIPEGLTQSITIPPSVGGGTTGRTDLIVARLDVSTYSTPPGPVRLQRFAGTEGSSALPSYDATPPSPSTLPLYAVTRREGEGLNQAIVRDLRIRIGQGGMDVASGGILPQAAPIGTRATRDGITWRREMVGSSPDWVQETWLPSVVSGNDAIGTGSTGWARNPGSRIEREGNRRTLHGEVSRGGAALTASSLGGVGDPVIATLARTGDRPPAWINAAARVEDNDGATYQAGVHISVTGNVHLNSTNPNVAIRRVIWDATWWTN